MTTTRLSAEQEAEIRDFVKRLEGSRADDGNFSVYLYGYLTMVIGELDAVRAERDFYKNACIDAEHSISQTLAQAIGGYPWYKDDPANFPNATEADGVCIGDETAGSLALTAARLIARLKEQLAAAAADVHVECLMDVEALREQLKRATTPDPDSIPALINDVANFLERLLPHLTGPDHSTIRHELRTLHDNIRRLVPAGYTSKLYAEYRRAIAELHMTADLRKADFNLSTQVIDNYKTALTNLTAALNHNRAACSARVLDALQAAENALE